MAAVFNVVRTGGREFRFFSIVALAYSGAFAITPFHQDVFLYVRYLFMVILPVSLVLPLVFENNTAKTWRALPFMLLYLFFITYGVGFSILWGGSTFFEEDSNRMISLALSVIYALIVFDVLSTIFSDEARWAIGIPAVSAFFCVSTLFVLLLGGLSLSPLALNFHSADEGELLYSQGFTKMCAIAGVYFLVIATNTKRSVGLYGISIAFLGLAVLSGSRGDILAGFFCVVLLLLRRPNIVNITVFSAAAVLLFVFVIQSGLWTEFVVFNRFVQLTDGDYSMRDLLFSEAITLIQFGNCNIVGCGFNYFQVWGNSEFGLYPHNVLLEMLITFGLLLGGGVALLSVVGAIVLYLRIGLNPLFYIFLVDFFTLQKSSSLIDFTALPTLLCFSWFGGRAFFDNRRIRKRRVPLALSQGADPHFKGFVRREF